MVLSTLLLFAFWVVSSSTASPLASISSIKCLWPSPFCKRAGTSYTVTTPIGVASGTIDASGAARYAAKYASATRWQASTVVTKWQLPNGGSDVTAMPLACPQPGLDDSQYSEDCLSVVLYVPTTINSKSKVPTLMWMHGGSFIVGSASDPALDGSHLAMVTQSIVAVVQYRLGAFGFMSPTGATNYAVKDMMSAMSFLQKVVPSFGGDASKITIAGQSSGAHMVRALLAAPSASSLFQNAILQSDPMDYGFLKSSVQTQLHNSFMSSLDCGTTNSPASSACWSTLSTDDVLNASMELFGTAYALDPSIGQFEPMRPVQDGSLITSPLDSTASFPKQTKPVLISTVMTEAGSVIYGNYPVVPESQFPVYVNASLGSARTATILSSPYYKPPASAGGADSTYDARAQLQTLGTDQIWKCASWTFARNWVSSGGTAYVGVYALGSTYPSNEGIPFCTQSGSVCHQDDIQIVFGTAPSPSPNQVELILQMQQRYKSFMNGGNANPNMQGIPHWEAATNSDLHALLLGGSGEASVDACVSTFWGQSVQYDYQVYGA